jgi:Ca2+-binding RTX toxin-like protein
MYSSALGPETMDGGSSLDINGLRDIDLIDDTSFTGSYRSFNMITGLTNIAGESFINFENATMGSANDKVSATDFRNVIDGGVGADIISGLAGNDTLYGRADNDFILGGSDNDGLYGGAGNDTLSGGDGNDNLYGEADKDYLFGDLGTDSFVFNYRNESLLAAFDVIRDYSVGERLVTPNGGVTLNSSVGTASALTSSAINAVLTMGVFTSFSNRAFKVSGQSGTFIAVNDSVAGFGATTDAIIHLENYNISTVNTVSFATIVI